MKNTIRKFIVSIVQMNSQANCDKNFEFIKTIVESAVKNKSLLVCLPENFNALYSTFQDYIQTAEFLTGKTIQKYRDLARNSNIWLSLGGFNEKIANDDQHIFNTHLLIDNYGEIQGIQQKLHMFDIDVDYETKYLESSYCKKGPKQFSPVETPFGKYGLSILIQRCYDIRFPELFRNQMLQGAQIFLTPAAFLQKTGEAHWETILRCRAIENQCFVIAPAQSGLAYTGRTSHGHSLVIDPWGKVLLDMNQKIGVEHVQIDLDYLDEIRKKLPCLNHIRKDLFYQ